MSKKDRLISSLLLIAGVLLHPLYRAIAGEGNMMVMVIGFVLIGLGIVYQFYMLFRNKQHAQLKRQALRLGIMVGVLLLLWLIWGKK